MQRIQAVAPWDPFTALARMDREFDSLVRRTWGQQRGAQAGFVPAVQIQRQGEDVVVLLEVPGVDVARDVSIEVDKGRLVVSGERRDERAEDSEGVLVRELRYGSFRREFALPQHVGAEQVSATYDAGVLRVHVKNVSPAAPDPVRVPIETRTSSAPAVLEHGQDRQE